MQFELHTIDITIIVVYFIFMVSIGLYFAGKNEGAQDYFLAGRRMIWPLVGFSLFASQISSTTLVGLAGDAYSTGISVYNYEWMSAVLMAFFAVFLLPLYLKSQVYTMPEYLERRYDGRARTYFAILTLFLNIVLDTAGSLYAGALIMKLIWPDIPIWQTIAVLAVIAGVYTIVGGLAAVMITDVIQAVLLIIGSTVIAAIAFSEAGGWANIVATVSPERLSLIRPMGDPGMPWLGLVLGVPLLGFYFWCTNQFMVQRVLGAKNIQHGRWGALLAGFLKLPVLFLMVLPGTAAIILYPNLERPDLVFPTLMFDLLPVGLLGLVLAGFIAALMSQIDSTLNSASTLVTMDFIRRRHPEFSSEKLMKVGRYVTFVFMLFAVLWAPQIEKFGSLFKYLQQVLAYGVPPVVCLFLFGTFWSRANAKGSFATIMVGIASAVLLFIANEIMQITNIHFLLVAPTIFAICCVAMIAVSMTTPPPDADAVAQYLWTPDTYRQESAELAGVAWYANYRVLAAIIVGISAGLVIWLW
ncbi:MAG: sodium:solute symporter [Pseudomonadota bacterium]